MITQLDSNRMFTEYCFAFHQIADFFHYAPCSGDLMKKKQELTAKKPSLSLIKALEDFNFALGADEKMRANLAQLAQGRTVIIGGQQAGLFTGPLYSFYKAVDLIDKSRQLTSLLGEPVIPVFWLASEDHDYQEINHVFAYAQNKIVKITASAKYRTRPSGFIKVKKRFFKAIDELMSYYDDATYQEQYKQLLIQQGLLADNLAQYFARLLKALLPDEGLLFFDPLSPALTEAKRDFLARYWPHQEEFKLAVLAKTKKLKQANYQVQIEKSPAHSNFFILEGQERRPIFIQDNHVYSKGAALSMGLEEFKAYLFAKPDLFSPAALLRPLFAEHLFKVLATINGPGEINYWGQLKEGFEVLNLRQPIIFPRRSLSIFPQEHALFLKKHHLDLVELIQNQDKILAGLLPFQAEQYQKIIAQLTPFRKPQERVFNIFPFLVKKGPAFITKIISCFAQNNLQHQFLQL